MVVAMTSEPSMTPADFNASLAKAEPPAGLSPALTALWWAGKDEWDKAHALAMSEEGPTAPGSMPTCTGSKATSTTPAIGIARRAAHRQRASLRMNGRQSPPLSWKRSKPDRAVRRDQRRAARTSRASCGSVAALSAASCGAAAALPDVRAEKIDQLFADFERRPRSADALIGADQRAQLDRGFPAVGDLNADDLGVPQFGLRDHLGNFSRMTSTGAA